MTRAKYRANPIRVELQCRCGRWKQFQGERCITCAIAAEQRNAAAVKARLRKRLDPASRRPQYDEHGRQI